MPLAGEAKRAYQRKWIAARRVAFFQDKRCVQCGGTERLELDHIDPARKITHNIWSWSQPRRETELQKCRVLCEGCHEKRTTEQKQERQTGKSLSAIWKRNMSLGMLKSHLRRLIRKDGWPRQPLQTKTRDKALKLLRRLNQSAVDST